MKHWKKFLAAFLSLLLVFAFACGCAQGTDDEEKDPPTIDDPVDDPTDDDPVEVERPTDEETRAMAMVDIILDNYAVYGGEGDDAYIYMKEYHNTQQVGYLWTNFCAVGMQYYVVKLYPDDTEEKEIFRQMLNNFLYYRQDDPESNTAENSVKYHSGRGNEIDGGGGDCFFDDNIWVARNYLRAYEIFGEEWYLEEAIRVWNWVISGWDEDLGGIVWSEVGLTDNATEQHLERGLSANACGIMVSAMLSDYAETQEEKEFYMDWAEKFYNFCKKMQNTPDTYDYWNGIHTVINADGTRSDGAVNRVHYSYNSGSMILADLLMYERVDDSEKQAYLDDAVNTAAAAQLTFNTIDPGALQFYYSGDPWFAAILCEAYYELREYAPEAADEYLTAFNENVTQAYRNRDVTTGLFPYQSTQAFSWDHNESYAIHQIGYAEEAVICALYSIEGGYVTEEE